MPERDGYIPGVPCWIDTSQPDPESVLDFYSGLFGWEFEDVMPPDSEGKYFIGRIRGGDVAAVGSQPEGAPPMATWNTYNWVENADATASKAIEAGGKAMMEPFDVMDAGRMGVLADPEGAVFCVWQAKQHKGARIVNEPGSLNFNGLNTRDAENAKRFYGSVFGWQIMALHAAERLGFEIPARTRTLAAQYVRLAAPQGHSMLAAYQPRRAATPTMTAEVLYARMLLGEKFNDAQIAQAVDFLTQQPPDIREL